MLNERYGANITLRELHSFFFDVLGILPITFYGAVGDNRTDNYANLQVAIDDANRRHKKYLYVPYGKYLYRGNLINRANLIFVGNPDAEIINPKTGEKIPVHQFGVCEYGCLKYGNCGGGNIPDPDVGTTATIKFTNDDKMATMKDADGNPKSEITVNAVVGKPIEESMIPTVDCDYTYKWSPEIIPGKTLATKEMSFKLVVLAPHPELAEVAELTFINKSPYATMKDIWGTTQEKITMYGTVDYPIEQNMIPVVETDFRYYWSPELVPGQTIATKNMTFELIVPTPNPSLDEPVLPWK